MWVAVTPDFGQIGVVFFLDGFEPGLVIGHQVHLIDGHRHLANPEQVQQVAVAAGLFLDPFLGIDDQQRRIPGGGPSDHVFQEFLVARRINDDVLAARGAEPNLRCVDGDALVPFSLQSIH